MFNAIALFLLFIIAVLCLVLILIGGAFLLLMPRLARNEVETAMRMLHRRHGKPPKITREQHYHIAIHEGGHVAVRKHFGAPVSSAELCTHDDGEVGGFTSGGDKDVHRLKDLKDALVSCYAGLMAEELILQEMSTGGEGDLRNAVDNAWFIVMRFGIEGHPPMDWGALMLLGICPTQIREACFAQVRTLLHEAQSRARAVVAKERSFIEAFAEVLIAQHHVSAKQIDDLYRQYGTQHHT